MPHALSNLLLWSQLLEGKLVLIMSFLIYKKLLFTIINLDYKTNDEV